MTKKTLFTKYKIDESHNHWDNEIDNWMSVELFRLMHDGRLPTEDDMSCKYLLEFMDKSKTRWFVEKAMSRPYWGSLYLTAKRMIYRHADLILKELN